MFDNRTVYLIKLHFLDVLDLVWFIGVLLLVAKTKEERWNVNCNAEYRILPAGAKNIPALS